MPDPGRSAAIAAVAQALMREGLLNNAGYIDGDEQRAAEVAVDAMEAVRPHSPLKRDITGTTGGDFALGPRPQPYRRSARPVRPAPPFGFGPPVAAQEVP